MNRAPVVSQPVADNVTDFQITYFKQDGTTMAPPNIDEALLAQVHKLQIEITVRSRDKDLNSGLYKEFTLDTEVTLRNR
jgi:hypothetical protein